MQLPEDRLRRQAITRRVIYLLVAIAVIVPFLLRESMPVEPSRQAEDLFEAVEALPEGSCVLLSLDYDPQSKEELYPMSKALLRHCFRRNLRPLVMTHWITNLGLCKNLLESTAQEAGKVSGRDYVFLGNRPGWGNLILNMGENLKGAFDKDFYDQPTADMPALRGIHSLRDIPLVIDVAAGQTVEMWISYGSDRFGFDLGAGCTAVIAPDLYPFHQSGQLVGFLGGLRGAADYETLLEQPGDGVLGMVPQSVTHLLIVALIVGANIHFFARWRRGGKEEAARGRT
ncbi:MAG: hypothetical protein ACLF0G_13905 [Candidatus Brocadiia bacterium]